MVKDRRAAPGPGPIRPLNLPAPLEVVEDGDGRPAALTLRGRRQEVASIDDLWEVCDEWWRPRSIARRYYQVLTGDGRRLTLFQDLVDGAWYHQRG